jgi:hypothetical protein
MKILALIVAMTIGQSLTLSAQAQTMGTDDKAAARAERKKEGAEAAKGPQMGEGTPIPEAKPKASAEERAAARPPRKATGAEAARGPQIGEAEPPRVTAPKVSSTDRSAARKTRKSEAAAANKAGAIKSEGETSY